MNVIIGHGVYDIEAALVFKTHSPFDCFVTLLYLLCSFHRFFILQINECFNALFGLPNFCKLYFLHHHITQTLLINFALLGCDTCSLLGGYQRQEAVSPWHVSLLRRAPCKLSLLCKLRVYSEDFVISIFTFKMIVFVINIFSFKITVICINVHLLFFDDIIYVIFHIWLGSLCTYIMLFIFFISHCIICVIWSVFKNNCLCSCAK